MGELVLAAEARAECERERADGIVRAQDRFNAAWRAWLGAH